MPKRASKPRKNTPIGGKGPKAGGKPKRPGRGSKTAGAKTAGPKKGAPKKAGAKATGKPGGSKPSGSKPSGSKFSGGKPSGSKAPYARKPAAGKRPAAQKQHPDDGKDRLQKVLAAAGIASRRECEQLILEGRVMVDDQPITELGVRVDPSKQEIWVDGEPLKKTKKVYFAVNKPEGYVCTARDPSGRPRVTELLPPQMGRVFNVGRLDMASEGLILLTNDGELANQLAHPRHGVQKTYLVQVAGHITAEELKTARDGIYIAEGKVHFVGAKIKSRHKKSTLLEVVLDEGRNREIRRVLAAMGHKVQKLTRVAHGPIKLGEMPAGAYRPLTREEVKALRQCVVDSEAAQEGKLAPKKKRKPAVKKPGAKKSASATNKAGRRVIE
ncbi:Ribosomal large subunit pseudouridine synthase B [Posidoniimonas polymericola]|uniref:Pseudouridine synthase n=1 Tax=Posidoniimonas polymericola TaxID=2528002 RepID=A0A5C5YMR1_9BACT|nr:pseudouridine synthase [Posidoniimonas polymericola]TWT76068.1 Ribosomal large subunit pseudouridine synthase B [Posidoniimonas polymericola]